MVKETAADRKKAQELGYKLARPENLDLLFEYLELHGKGLEAWKKKRAKRPKQ